MSISPVSSYSSQATQAQSDTSTLVYGQEPFDQYVTRVKNLVRNKWPSVTDENITVERIKGGGYNRIIGFSVRGKDGAGDASHVLRIPRFDDAQTASNVASLQFVGTHSQMPVPEIVDFDITTRNALESAYMIQSRCRGGPVLLHYPSMSQRSRHHFARQLGEVIAGLTSLRSQHIGRLTSSKDDDEHLTFLVHTPDNAGPAASRPYTDAPATQDMCAALVEIFNYQRDKALETNDFRAEHTQQWATMASEMGAMGYLRDVSTTLCHMDFEPRNILVDLQDLDNPLSGIIDWDLAIFGPSFMSCTPPMWIWSWKDNEEEDERTANDIPSTKEERELKDIFEKAAGPVFMRFAYDPVYRLARRLFQFAVSGISCQEQSVESDVMLQEWCDVKVKAT
jgi:aminoglycoside phosphotransferase (APT) family kinase protein